MSKYYCEYCGTTTSSIATLTANSCQRHPEGSYKGKHKLYEGSEKAEYSCKFCGIKSPSISSLTANTCQRHPAGSYKGKHATSLH